MNEQARKRLRHLQKYCYDSQIDIKAQLKCGKTIASLESMVVIYKILEEVIQKCLDEPG